MTAAPADQRKRPPWPPWRRVGAYSILFAVAAASIWLIDRNAVRATPDRVGSEDPVVSPGAPVVRPGGPAVGPT